MKRTLLGLTALALVATLSTACTESRTDRVGERSTDRTPSASPPTATPPPPAAAPSTPADSTKPGSATSSPSSPSGSGTK